MKINGISGYMQSRSLTSIKINSKKENTDTIAIGINAELSTNVSSAKKDYGELFAEYLKDIGFCGSMSEEQVNEFEIDIKQNIYSFDSNNVSNIYESFFKITDSIMYLRSIANRLMDSQKSEMLSLIDAYKKNSYQSITDYTNNLIQKAETEEQNEYLKRLQEMVNETNMLLDQLESSKEEMEAMEESFEILSNCMKIAMRLLHGDKVPAEDIQYLMENQPDLYKMAMTMRNENDDPKEYESVLEDEDSEADSENSLEPIELSDVIGNAAERTAVE